MGSLSPSSAFFPWVTGSILSLILVVPGAYAVLTLWLFVYGLWHVKGFFTRVWHPSLTIGASPIWVGMAVYVFFGVAVGWWYGYKASFFDAYLPMFIAPFIVNAVVTARPPQAMLWIGCSAAAILAGFVALYQSLVLDMGRAGGAMNNVIIFGDLSVVLFMFCIFGWVYWGRKQKTSRINALLISGSLFGLFASLLSGTKGGWLSIIMIVIIFSWLLEPQWEWYKKTLLSLIMCGFLILVAMLSPPELVLNRILSGFNGGAIWFSSGQITEGSVSIRLEKWSQAISMIAEKPWLGWSVDQAIIQVDLRLRAAGLDQGPVGYWTQVENELLQAGINHGLPAVFSYLFLYVGILIGFIRIRQKYPHNLIWVGLASVGSILPVLMLEFGLSVNVLGRNAFRHTFILLSMLVLGYLIILWQQRHQL